MTTNLPFQAQHPTFGPVTVDRDGASFLHDHVRVQLRDDTWRDARISELTDRRGAPIA